MWLFTPDGQRKRPARVVKTLDWSMVDDTVLPPWLEQSGGGVLAFNRVSAGDRGSLTLPTDGTDENTAKIQTPFTLNLADLWEVSLRLDGLSYDSEVGTSGLARLTLGCVSDTSVAGAVLRHDAGDTNARVRVLRAVGQDDTEVPYQLRKSDRRNIEVSLYPKHKQVVVWQDDIPIIVQPAPNFVVGVVRPCFYITAATAAVRSLSVARVRLTLVHN